MINSVSILTFSGTGNTQFAVDALIQALAVKGINARSYALEMFFRETHDDDPLAADLVGIAFPVHAFNPPPLVEKLLKKLPRGQVKKYFIIKTSGSPFADGGSTNGLKRIMSARFSRLVYEAVIPMPSNFGGRYPDEAMKLMLQMAQRQVEVIADDMIAGKKKVLVANGKTAVLSSLMKLERIGAHFYGHHLKVDDKCTNCGKCVRNCPTGNIRNAEGRLRFGWRCTFCMRCSFNCPVQAIYHMVLKRTLMTNPPYDLHKILNDEGVIPISMDDNKYAIMKELRSFWKQAGLYT